jgi:tetratricopeptide (TPR) repeat protein
MQRPNSDEKALDAFAAAIRMAPEQAAYYSARRKLHWRLGLKEAFHEDGRRAKWLEDLYKMEPPLLAGRRTGQQWIEYAAHWAKGGEFANAIRAYDDALKLAPESVPALLGRGAARLQGGDAAGAMADAERVLALEDLRAVHSLKADAHARLEDYDAAIREYELARRFDSDVAHAYLKRSERRRIAGQTDAAASDLQQARLLDPRLEDAPR